MRKLALSLTLAATLALVLSASAQAQVLLGDQSVAPYGDGNVAGVAQAFQYTATASGAASAIQLYVDDGTSATKVMVGLYSDKSGRPGSLLASGSLSSPQGGAWNDIAVSGTASITSGQTYWIALLGTGGQINYPDSPGGSASYVESNASLTSLPATYSSGTEYNVSPASAYIVAVSTMMLVGDQSMAASPDSNNKGAAQAFVYTAAASAPVATSSFTSTAAPPRRSC